MLSACLLAIGNELLNGEIRDLNLHSLSRKLTKLGFTVQHAMMTRDDPHYLMKTLRFLHAAAPDILLCSGGLGPTVDDLTLPVVAETFDRPLELNTKALRFVRKQYDTLIQKGYLEKYGPEDAQIKMATLPRGATPLRNPIGTAPGVLMQIGKTACYLLPGVPRELEAIWEYEIMPRLQKQFTLSFWAESAILVHCDDEAELAVPLARVSEKYPEVYIKSLAKPFPAAHQEGIRIIATTHAASADLAGTHVSNALKALKDSILQAGFSIEDIHSEGNSSMH